MSLWKSVFGGAFAFIAIRAAVQSAHRLTTTDDWLIFWGGYISAAIAAWLLVGSRK